MKMHTTTTLVLCLALLLAGCSGGQQASSGSEGGSGETAAAHGAASGTQGESASAYKIVTTVGMVRDIAEAVAGERAEVSGIMGEGVDPHLYTPTRSDVQLLQSADIVFYVGLLLEGKMSDTLVRIASGGGTVYPVTELMEEE